MAARLAGPCDAQESCDGVSSRCPDDALVPLGAWFVFTLLSQPDLSHASIVAWLANPWQAGLMLAFGWCALWHSAQGLQVVVDDYVPGPLHPRVRQASALASP